MADHSSATVREHTPQANRNSRTNTFVNALKRRAQAVLNDRSIDPQSRAIIRYALEVNDPWLVRLVRRAEAGEPIDDNLEFGATLEAKTDDSDEEKIEALTNIICGDDGQSGTRGFALFVLMAIIEDSSDPKALANTAKHLACSRCR